MTLANLFLAGLLLIQGEALAQEPVQFPPEILYVPPGSTLYLGSKRNLILGKAWLFPEGHYLNALQKAEKLAICEPAFLKLREDYASLLDKNTHGLSSCSLLLEESHKREEELTSRALGLEAQNAELRNKLSSARKSTFVSWAVTGSLLLGAAYVTLH